MDSTRIQMPFMSERNRKMENNEQDFINIINATENNLKHVSLKIPKKQITVFTGVSGSGKSSLCLDTIAAESRRELNVTFPSFVQQFLPKYGRPEVDRMENLPVTIVIDQKKPAANSRLVLTPIFMRCCACFFLVSENLLSDIRIVFPSIIQAENVSAAKVLEL